MRYGDGTNAFSLPFDRENGSAFLRNSSLSGDATALGYHLPSLVRRHLAGAQNLIGAIRILSPLLIHTASPLLLLVLIDWCVATTTTAAEAEHLDDDDGSLLGFTGLRYIFRRVGSRLLARVAALELQGR